MDGALLVDLLVVVTLLTAVLSGWARGLGRTVGALAGAVGGALLALAVVVPWAEERLGPQTSPTLLVVVAGILCVVTGAALGTALGGLLHRALTRIRLGWLDAAGGALAGAVITAVIWVLVAALVPVAGSATVTDSVSSSRALAALTRVVPDELQDRTALARALERSQPWLAEVAGSPSQPPSIPAVDVDSAALQSSSASVVRVSGDARACRSVVTGSGFVVAPDRVMTNAHVVAGVDAPVVRAPGELPVTGRVVYVDERQDLAVVATDGLDAPALSLRTGARSGDVAVVAGYPHGVRQLQLEAAQVVGQRSTIVTTDGQSRLRRVLTLASDIQQGNSGGPVLGSDGHVIGVVFAKAVAVDRVAYAVPASVAAPVVERAPGMTEAVPTGSCTAA